MVQTTVSPAPQTAARRWLRLLKRLLLVVTRVYGVLSPIAIVFVLLDKTDISILELFKTFLVLGLLLAPVFWLVALRWGRRWLALLLIPAVVISIGHYARYFISAPVSVSPDAPRITVLTINLNGRTPPNDLARFVEILSTSGADVIATQEMSRDAANTIGAALRETHPYQALHVNPTIRNRGQGIFSRYPILADEYWQYDDLPMKHGQQHVIIRLGDAEIVIYNVHPWPAVNWRGLQFLNFYSDEDVSHRVSAQRIIARAREETLPTLLLGDFNMTEQFVEYETMTAHFSDAHLSAGNTLGYTFRPFGFSFIPPMMRLDYVFYSDHFVALETRLPVYAAPSDHLPLMATLALINTTTEEQP